MRAFVLAGGLGTRLRPALPDLPKPLAPIAGRPFITYLLSWLRRHEVSDVTLCLGYKAETVRDTLGDGRELSVRLAYSVEPEPLGTGGALKLALTSSTEPALVVNGDTYCDFDLSELLAAHEAADGWATLALWREGNGTARGCVELDEDGYIIAFNEKPPVAESVLVSAGVYVFGTAALESLPAPRAFSLEREFFPGLAAARRLRGHVVTGYFVDIGTPETWRQFEQDLAENKVR